ncbi:unnamed protein product [Moneuplotes crassus]|uniref:RBR-type E3 ubiquitin transferase n=1 Tax=Euplotes crassus TaxID=5936 RepID=A0AAD1XC66_EUPCR|nr:unnamed protein product [Moneuplotes crassus]
MIGNCSLCTKDIEHHDVFAIDTCGTLVHQICISKYIKNKIDQEEVPIFCPNEGCKCEISIEDINQLCNETYIRKFFMMDPNYTLTLKKCPDAGCNYILSPAEVDQEGYFKCPECLQEYCFSCSTAWHKGITCWQNTQMEKLLSRSKNKPKGPKNNLQNKKRKCPGCSKLLLKEPGCNIMTCCCSTRLCYLCGVELNIENKCECPSMHALFHPKIFPSKSVVKTKEFKMELPDIQNRSEATYVVKSHPKYRKSYIGFLSAKQGARRY